MTLGALQHLIRAAQALAEDQAILVLGSASLLASFPELGNPADSHFDFLGYRFKRSRRGRLIKLVRPKSLRKLRDTIKPRTKRTSGRSMEAMIAELNPKLQGWFGYFKHAHTGQLGEIDGWIRGRLRSILRKRRGLEGRGRGKDHQRWPNRYFAGLGLYCLLEAKVTGIASLRQGATH